MNKMSRPAALAATLLVSLCGCAQVAGLMTPGGKGPKVHSPLTFARLFEEQGDVERARQLYTAAAKKPATRAEALHRLAVLTDRAGDSRRAEQYFEQARRLKPNDAALWNDFGYHYLLAGRLFEAEGALRRALRIEPDNARAMDNLAVTLGKQGRMQESLEAFRQVLSEAEAYANVAALHAQRGDSATAAELYEQALALDPTLVAAADGLAKLGGDRNAPASPQSAIQTVAASFPEPAASPAAAASTLPGQAAYNGTSAARRDATPVEPAAPAAPALLPEQVEPSDDVGFATIGFAEVPPARHTDQMEEEAEANQPRESESPQQQAAPQPGWEAVAAPESDHGSGWKARR